MEKEIRLAVLLETGGEGKGNWRKMVKSYLLPVIRQISRRNVNVQHEDDSEHSCKVQKKTVRSKP